MARDSCVALRRHDAELGQMRPQGIDQLGAPANSQFARVSVFSEGSLTFRGNWTRATPDSRNFNRNWRRNAVNPVVMPLIHLPAAMGWCRKIRAGAHNCADRFELRSRLIRW